MRRAGTFPLLKTVLFTSAATAALAYMYLNKNSEDTEISEEISYTPVYDPKDNKKAGTVTVEEYEKTSPIAMAGENAELKDFHTSPEDDLEEFKVERKFDIVP